MHGIGEMLMGKKKKAYLKGREEGFDKGFNTAKMIFEAVTADAVQKAIDLKKEIEELNSELIIGEEEDDGDTD